MIAPLRTIDALSERNALSQQSYEHFGSHSAVTRPKTTPRQAPWTTRTQLRAPVRELTAPRAPGGAGADDGRTAAVTAAAPLRPRDAASAG
ncbi:protein of unknown function [Streptantibioticus cattleyicolor NRRL 8057 = DSM 46488]|nr:protein of unknown function [Streptantibioticus cattleyicolor NRRL 8057 = DSM 46488]